MPLAISGLRFRLLLVILLALIPGSALALANTLDVHRRESNEVQAHALLLTRSAATSHERLIESAHQLLVALA